MTVPDDREPTVHEIRYLDVHVQLSGRDGNAYAIIGAVSGALRRQVSPQAATEFAQAAVSCGSYDELLQLAQRTVEVS